MSSVEGRCTFEILDSADLLDAIDSVSGKVSPGFGNHGFSCPKPGDESDYLAWALADIQNSWDVRDESNRKRNLTNALMNAKRELSRLVDWYMSRDGFVHCKDAPKTSREKSELLVQRGIIDHLTARVLARAIDARNTAEHEYRTVGADRVEDIVELMRRTIQSVLNTVDPQSGPCLFGRLGHGISHREGHSTTVRFFGWSDEAAILVTFDEEPWIGIILPDAKDHAVVRRLPLRSVTCALLAQALQILEGKFGKTTGGGYSAPLWRLLFEATGLDRSAESVRSRSISDR
jgi:hypothetical protein